ncbi:MAG TPA: ABC transporter permease [Candidatus Atribacteria bacterium]|nr:ABC transporter permease [Candidatus Atribacteria bacterium]
MKKYILRRILYMIPILLGISIVSFIIINLAPGDFLSKKLLDPHVSSETIARLKTSFGLDKPPIIQYFMWLKNAIHLDFGYSFAYRVPVFTLIAKRIGNTLILMGSAMIFAWTLGILIGIYSAVHEYSFFDKFFTFLAFFGLAIPNFFFGLLLLYMATKTGWFPVGGVTSIGYEHFSLLGKIWDRIWHLILPTIVLGTSSMASVMRQMRGNLIEALRADYVRTARAKGLPEKVVIYKHAFRNAINPLVTMFGLSIPGLLSGAALTEIVMNWPGMGQLILEAVISMDLYLVMGSLMLSSFLLLMGNLLADILLVMVDPRIRYE